MQQDSKCSKNMEFHHQTKSLHNKWKQNLHIASYHFTHKLKLETKPHSLKKLCIVPWKSCEELKMWGMYYRNAIWRYYSYQSKFIIIEKHEGALGCNSSNKFNIGFGHDIKSMGAKLIEHKRRWIQVGQWCEGGNVAYKRRRWWSQRWQWFLVLPSLDISY